MTKVYGHSDNFVKFEGDVNGEVEHYENDDEHGIMIICSDGTLLEAKYGKNNEGIWEVKLLKQGELFERIEICDDENAEIYSDIAYFKDGLKYAYATSKWELIK